LVTRLVYDLPEAEYHADRDTLSSTGAKTLLRSPAQFRWEQDGHPVTSDAFVVGSLVHALVLGQPYADIQVKLDGRTKEGKAQKAQADADGLRLISQDDWDSAHRMADAVLGNRMAADLFSNGRAEVSAYGTEPISGVAMRGRFDWLRNDGGIVDLKTTANAEPNKFRYSTFDYGYYIQAAWYWHLGVENGIDVSYYPIVAVGKSAPHQVTICELKTAYIEDGWAEAEKACDIYKRCRAFGEWPDWPENQEVYVFDNPRRRA